MEAGGLTSSSAFHAAHPPQHTYLPAFYTTCILGSHSPELPQPSNLPCHSPSAAAGGRYTACWTVLYCRLTTTLPADRHLLLPPATTQVDVVTALVYHLQPPHSNRLSELFANDW